MKKILVLNLTLVILLGCCFSVLASDPDSKEAVRDSIKDVLFDYKDAYNLRDFDAIRALYTDDALIMSFPCGSTNEVPFNEFSESLPRCASYWVDGAFKLRLFKITSFELSGDKCTVRVSWNFRDNSGRTKFNPTFEFTLVNGSWKISKEIYGRMPATSS